MFRTSLKLVPRAKARKDSGDLDDIVVRLLKHGPRLWEGFKKIPIKSRACKSSSRCGEYLEM